MKKIIAFLLLAVMLVLGFSFVNRSQAQNFTHKVPTKHVLAHRDVQDYLSFPRWRKEQPRRRRQAIRYAVKQHKSIMKVKRRRARITQYEIRVRQRIKSN